MCIRDRSREDIKTRLADSLETAIQASNGLVTVTFIDQDREDILFSAQFCCPICQHSISELEPRSFSFNNPAGACKTCDGLGLKQFFDPQNIIQNDELSLSEGAIYGWDRRNIYYFQMLESLAKHYGFDLTKPFKNIDKAHRVSREINSGIVWINSWMIRDLRIPFGGMKQSGVGREGGFKSLDFFTETKNVCIKIN